MRSVTYHSYNDNSPAGLNMCNRASADFPILINCAGTVSIEEEFTTHNKEGRLDYYLMYIVDGRMKVRLGSQLLNAGAGDFIIFPPNNEYWYHFSGRGVISYYFVHFTGSFVESLLSSLGLDALPVIQSAGYSEAATQAFYEILEAFSRDDGMRDISLSAALLRALVALRRATEEKDSRAPLSRSLAYIKGQYIEKIRIPELAAMEGLSVSRYNYLFREVTGSSPVRYITELRMMHAASLLRSTDLPIGRIGAMVGYEDNHFFSKTFKSYSGYSPQNYRFVGRPADSGE